MSGWKGPLVGFDLETTGTDPETSRIVSVAVVDTVGARLESATDWLLDPGVQIPAEATAVHGITTAEARDRGRPAAEGVESIAEALCSRLARGHPVVAFNAPFCPRTPSASQVSHVAGESGTLVCVGVAGRAPVTGVRAGGTR